MFEGHGDVRVNWQANVLTVNPLGAFNAQGALQINRRVESSIEQNACHSWFRFECFTDEDTLGTPDARASLVAHFVHSREHGCQLVCLCGGNICVREWFKGICVDADIPCAEFKTREDALRHCQHSESIVSEVH